MRRLKQRSVPGVLVALVYLTDISPVFARQRVMTNADVLDLTEGGVSEWNIIAMVLVNKSAFSTTPSDIAALRSAGVTEAVINAMTLQAAPPSSVASKPATPRSNRASSSRVKRSTSSASPNAPQTIGTDEELRRIEQFESEQRARGTAAAPLQDNAPNVERERQLIERFEAEQRARGANSAERSTPGRVLTSEDELQMIRQFEEERGAGSVKQPESGGGSGFLTEEEELRLIEDYEARQKPTNPKKTSRNPCS